MFAMLLALGLVIGGVQLWLDGALSIDLSEGFGDPVAAILLLAIFLLWRPALWLALRLLHKRSLASLNGPPTGFWLGAAVAFAIAVVNGLIAVIVVDTPLFTGVDLLSWAMFAALAAPLIYIQSSAEELLFRGYILQQMQVRFQAFWAWALAPSILFGLLHWNPTGYGAAAVAVLALTGLTGLTFALVTAATGSLSLAKGLHFGLNISALLLIAPNEAFSALALAHWPSDEASVQTLVYIDLVTAAAFTAAAYVWWRRRSG